MRKKILLLLFSILSFGTNSFAQYHKDILGENFVQQTIQMPDDYEGKVIITIIRKEAAHYESNTLRTRIQRLFFSEISGGTFQ